MTNFTSRLTFEEEKVKCSLFSIFTQKTLHFIAANEALQKYEDASFDFYVASCSSQFQNSDYISLLYQVLEKFSFAKANDIVGKRKQFTFQKYLLRHILNKFSRDPLKAKYEEIKTNYYEIVTSLLNDDSNDESLSTDDLLLKGTKNWCFDNHICSNFSTF